MLQHPSGILQRGAVAKESEYVRNHTQPNY
jgi:hypothetical protein